MKKQKDVVYRNATNTVHVRLVKKGSKVVVEARNVKCHDAYKAVKTFAKPADAMKFAKKTYCIKG